MKNSLILLCLSMSGACQARAETAPVAVDVLKWFDGCAQLTQPALGMVMDVNCSEMAMQYCMTGRPKAEWPKCLADLSEHMVSQSTSIRASIPQSIKGTTWQARSYARRYQRLVEDVSDFCDSSPIDEIPPDAWCDFYLKTDDWVQWRSLQRLALETKQ